MKSTMEEKLETEFRLAPLSTAVSVDFPKTGERVVSREYAIRISAAAGSVVEASIDDDAWLPCRRAVGYWWRDWSGYGAGPHSVLARVTIHRGRRTLSGRRNFVVEP
jgi:hypothetical protein